MCICVYLIISSELDIGHRCSVPGRMPFGTVETSQLSQTRLVHEPLFLALPKEILVLYCQWSQTKIKISLLSVVVDSVVVHLLLINFD